MVKIRSSLIITVLITVCMTIFIYQTQVQSQVQNGVKDTKTGSIESRAAQVSQLKGDNVRTVNGSGQNVPYGQEIAEVLSVAKAMNVKPLLVTLINGAYLQFALSWLCNTEHMNIHYQVLIITTDIDTKDRIKTVWPEVNVVAISGMPLNGDQSYSHAGYVRLTNFRAHVLLELLLGKQEIFLFEVDALWVKNPVPKMSQTRDCDILANPVAERPGLTAIGFLYLFPTTPTIMTWEALNKKLYVLDQKIKALPPGKVISEGDNDQLYLSHLVNKRIGGLTKKTLPLEDYSDGKWYDMTEDKRKASHPFVINNNWVIGNAKKVSRAKDWGHWFLNDDQTCNKQQVKKITKNGEFWHKVPISHI